MAETVRAFVAVELPDEVKEYLWQLQEKLQSYAATRVARWADPWEAHLTLKFLGEVPIPRLPAIVASLDEVAERREPFTMRLADLGAFPNVYRPSVLWVGVEEGRQQLVALADSVEATLKPLGFKPERREFQPHITLARLRRDATPRQRRELGELVGPTPVPDFPATTVSHVSLIRSLLLPQGSRYVRLSHSAFGEAPPLQADDWEDIE
ncbi:MAG: RNA 2',3'-cyclic phosphodiesterase [Ardenticatenaceae bacterium]|nr:RNA 2',3'-cyclic phosphodiesterase [Ardenticatenaceae bacterium]